MSTYGFVSACLIDLLTQKTQGSLVWNTCILFLVRRLFRIVCMIPYGI